MTVVVKQRCIDCHQLKARTDFPVIIVGRNSRTGKPRRTWKPYCKACEIQRMVTGKNPDREVDKPERTG